jgi:di/tricarboxylate transporter
LIAAAGVLFIILIGWRLIPERKGQSSREQLFEIEDYISEVKASEDAKAIGQKISELENIENCDVTIIALVRDDRRINIPPQYETVRNGDTLIIEADAENLKTFIDKTGLVLTGGDKSGKEVLQSEETSLLETIILPDSRLINSTIKQANIRWRYGINLIGVARQGARLKQRLQNISFRAGDVLLLQGPSDNIYEALRNLGCLPLAERDLGLGQPRRIVFTIALFTGAILVNTFGLLPVHIAMTSAAVIMVLSRLVSLREAYDTIDWPIIILLGAMLPVGAALESTGAAANIAQWLGDLSDGLPPVMVVAILLISTMWLTDIINNAAAAVLMAPIAIGLAQHMGVSADTFLMTIAIGASCAFLTPIGHQSNTLVMGPGGYQFGDYWRMGLPLQIIVILVAIPALLWIWPL